MSLQTNRHIIINVNVIYVTVNYRQVNDKYCISSDYPGKW